jgi:hypothetical protein
LRRALANGDFAKLLINVMDYVQEVNAGPNMECLAPTSTFGELLDTLVTKKRHRWAAAGWR